MSTHPITYPWGPMDAPRRVSLALVRRAVVLMLLVLASTLILGNLTIVSAHLWSQRTIAMTTPDATIGVHNLYRVDEKLIRGGRPDEQAYRDLAAAGVTTVVDLRAEDWVEHPTALLNRLGIEIVHIPMRDGQAPTDEQANRFIAAVRDSEGQVYVHCMAGVGRTGAMVAAYLVEEKGVDPVSAVRLNMAVGPPSLEQIGFAAGADQSNPLLVGFSRVLDAPRRMWTYVN